MKTPLIRLLALFWTIFLLQYPHACQSANCTSGFMKQDLLTKRSEKISLGNSVSPNVLQSGLYITTSLSFTCSGTITSVFLGGDIQPAGSQYPEVQIWRFGHLQSESLNRIARAPIYLGAGDFSPDGVLQYTLQTPLQFRSGDLLGIYQPSNTNSVVRLFYASDPTGSSAKFWSSNSNSVTLATSSTVAGQTFLLRTETSPSGCMNGLLSYASLRQMTLDVNINSVVARYEQQRVFPDIRFTCDGFITKWIVGVDSEENGNSKVQLQILRPNGSPNSYTRVHYTELRTFTTENVYSQSLDPPLGFKQGDVLGVYYYRSGRRIVVYNQRSTGPRNYRVQASLKNPGGSEMTVVETNEYDYPLVAVETVGQEPLPVIPIQPVNNQITTTNAQQMTTNLPTTSTQLTPNLPSTSSKFELSLSSTNVKLFSSTLSTANTQLTLSQSGLPNSELNIMTSLVVSSATNLPTSGSQSFIQSPYLTVAIICATIVFVVALLLCVGSLWLAVYWRKQTKQQAYSTEQVQINTLDLAVNRRIEAIYEAPMTASDNEENMLFANTQVHLQEYSVPITSAYNLVDAMIVPTMSQRSQLRDYHDLYSQQQIHPYHQLEVEFFQESEIYWEPGSDCSSIYTQLAQNRFREIIREQIVIERHLSSGQFGTVEKGLWFSTQGPIEVAVKALKEESSERNIVMLLQEAAIMGQFHHPNVVQLLGVVTMGEPVMIVLEFVRNGDLKTFLRTRCHIPGEMAPLSIPQRLLGYCRQIASGMEYLSKKSFVHRDLAARNILVDDERTCKIADFGMSRDLSCSEYYFSHGGKIPVKWTAPEAIFYKKYSTASDVWSFGVLMYEIWSLGRNPFEDKSNTEYLGFIKKGHRLSSPRNCPRAVYQIMAECWHAEASDRPSFAHLVSRLAQPEYQLLKRTDSIKSVNQVHTTPTLPVSDYLQPSRREPGYYRPS